MQQPNKRHSNHSIDRLLLILLLRQFYRERLVFLGNRREYKTLETLWTADDRERWDTERILTAPLLARAMNIWLGQADAAQLLLEQNDQLSALKSVMAMQYADVREREMLCAQHQRSPRTEPGIQRKTVSQLLHELVAWEQRLGNLDSPAQADSISGTLLGFRLRPCFPDAPDARAQLFLIDPAGQPDHNLAAVQTAYYPFLDQGTSRKVLDKLLLSAERRQNMEEILENKAAAPIFPHAAGLNDMLALALDAAQQIQSFSCASTPDLTAQTLFWYEAQYHSWQWSGHTLCLAPRPSPIPLLPWQVIYSNGYFYLSGFRLDLDPAVTGGKRPENGLTLSNLRLDRISRLDRMNVQDGMLDEYSLSDLRAILTALGGRLSDSLISYRNASTIMYAGQMETLYIDCHISLMNNAVDDFGLDNLSLIAHLPEKDWVRIRIEHAVWKGARQWLLQHADACHLSAIAGQTEKRREMAACLTAAAQRYR